MYCVVCGHSHLRAHRHCSGAAPRHTTCGDKGTGRRLGVQRLPLHEQVNLHSCSSAGLAQLAASKHTLVYHFCCFKRHLFILTSAKIAGVIKGLFPSCSHLSFSINIFFYDNVPHVEFPGFGVIGDCELPDVDNT